MTVSVSTLINGCATEAVIDSAAMVTLVQEEHFRSVFTPQDFGPVCVLTGIGTDPVHGQLVHNVPITVGTQTFLHTVCVAPISDQCLLGLDFLKVTGSVLDLANDVLEIDGNVILSMSPCRQCYKFPKSQWQNAQWYSQIPLDI